MQTPRAGLRSGPRCLELIQAAARGELAHELAAEGGMESIFWAGPQRSKGPAQLVLSATLEMSEGKPPLQIQYEVVVGFRQPTAAAFPLEPQIKRETLSMKGSTRPVVLLSRENAHVMARDEDGTTQSVDLPLLASETALSRLDDPGKYPIAFEVRRALLDWRFYHGFRSDRLSAIRHPDLAVATPTLAADGSNLAAVFATLAHIREDLHDVNEAISAAFPGARLDVPEPERTATFGLVFPEHPRRTFQAGELSDGTIQYLALIEALMAYRLPPFVALNEPEASLHPSLLKPLAILIAKASKRSQVWLVTHSQELAAALESEGALPRTVVRKEGGTWIEGLTALGDFDD